ncbi:MAG: efflux RND transporter periplasmic adaptor subunit [Bryobacterales bacterium]|nr:efflux RND transporter periplasmic adaptor subunit [Bryobacterales bacterium]
MSRSQRRGKARILAGACASLAGLALLAFGYSRYGRASTRYSQPTATAKQGEFLVTVTCRGELVAQDSTLIVAPNVPDLRIVWQATSDSLIQEGETMLRFDPSTATRMLKEKEAALAQAQAALDQATAQTRITEEQDKLELAQLRHTVERARLEVSKAEIVSKLQAEESRIDLKLAEEKLKVQQATLDHNKASGESKIASLQSQRDKTQAEVDLYKRRIARMEVKAPSSGVVSYLMNYSQGWMNAKPFRVGDQVWPGSSVAEIPDLKSLQLKAKVEEIERGKIRDGQSVKIVIDPFPEKVFAGRLASISALTEQNFEWPPSRNFRAFGAFDEMDKRLRPGMNGRLDIVVDRIPDAISVPARALVTRMGKPAVLLVTPQGVQPEYVEVLARNPDEVAIKGIQRGATVALVDDQKPAAPGAKQ